MSSNSESTAQTCTISLREYVDALNRAGELISPETLTTIIKTLSAELVKDHIQKIIRPEIRCEDINLILEGGRVSQIRLKTIIKTVTFSKHDSISGKLKKKREYTDKSLSSENPDVILAQSQSKYTTNPGTRTSGKEDEVEEEEKDKTSEQPAVDKTSPLPTLLQAEKQDSSNDITGSYSTEQLLHANPPKNSLTLSQKSPTPDSSTDEITVCEVPHIHRCTSSSLPQKNISSIPVINQVLFIASHVLIGLYAARILCVFFFGSNTKENAVYHVSFMLLGSILGLTYYVYRKYHPK